MKKIHTLILLSTSLSLTNLWSQYNVTYYADGGNPGALHNEDEFGGSGWTSIYDCSTIANWTHIYSTAQTIPFSFSFNGAPVTQYKVANSGYITFDIAHATPASSSSVTNLPHSSLPDNAICAWGIFADMQSSFAKIEYKVFGTAGSQQLWIAFRSFFNPNGTDAFDFTYWAIVLEEGTNNIYIVRQWEVDFGGVWEDFPVSVGVQIDNTNAIEAPGNPITIAKVNNSNLGSDNDYWEFAPSQVGIEDFETNAGNNFYPNPANGMITLTNDFGIVRILDVSGKVVYQNSTNGLSTLDVSNLSPGSYIFAGSKANKVFTETLIIQ